MLPTTITFDELRASIAEVVLLDVATAASFARAHLPRAASLPIEELPGALAARDARLPSDLGAPLVVYCAGAT
jgi:rhodanese-related sulfurtransferase